MLNEISTFSAYDSCVPSILPQLHLCLCKLSLLICLSSKNNNVLICTKCFGAL